MFVRVSGSVDGPGITLPAVKVSSFHKIISSLLFVRNGPDQISVFPCSQVMKKTYWAKYEPFSLQVMFCCCCIVLLCGNY